MRNGCVSVHHHPFVIDLRVKELVSNPDQIVLHLVLHWNTGSDAGMNEQIVAACAEIAQALQEQQMRAREHVAERAMKFRRHKLRA